ncbi:hypothetical protein WJX81_003497 [Elliptochloris bilobata]|uniref:Glutamate decarboxylase n=1 Tax=Elliptochloris bilobata TaxID=381761 RepID=A0AAW1SDQ8_9CHLO
MHEHTPIADGKAANRSGRLADWDGDKAAAFLKQAANLLCEHMASRNDLTQPVVRLASPAELAVAFTEAGVPLELRVGEDAASMPRLLAALGATLEHSVRTAHPLFLNQLYARPEPAGIAGDWLTVVANTNVHTYEAAPVFTLVERAVLARLAVLAGPSWAAAHDGLFVPGGSIANMYGMHLARAVVDPDSASRGAAGGPCLVAFTSAQAHYSYLKSARVCGLGSDNLVAVPCDASGAMLPAELEVAVEAALARGGVPFFVGATAGSTVLGAFDPLVELAKVCRRHNMWLHCDGAWGGACLLSAMHRGLMDGVELVDSLALNPHKMMGLPLQCSVFLARREGLLQSTNSSNADYLFQPDKLHADMDLGDKTIQCGRRADAYKLWLTWKALGDAGLEQRMDRNIALAAHVEARVVASGGAFQMVRPRSFANVCFWWLPRALRPFDAAAASPEQLTALGKVAPALKMRMQQSGDAMIGFQPLDGLPNFFRLVFASASALRFEDLDALMSRMDALGLELFP